MAVTQPICASVSLPHTPHTLTALVFLCHFKLSSDVPSVGSFAFLHGIRYALMAPPLPDTEPL